MLKLKTIVQSALLSAALVFFNEAFCMNDLDSKEDEEIVGQAQKVEHDFAALEHDFPMLFSGFTATPFELIEKFRSLEKRERLQPMEEIREAMEVLSTQLEALPQFTLIKIDLDKRLLTPGEISIAEYAYYLVRIAASQGAGTDEEEAFFKGAGFSWPYASIQQGDWAAKLSERGVSSIQDFISLFDKMESVKHDDRGDFKRATYRYYYDDENTVRKAIKKGPFARTAWPLPGKDILGLFYLAFTYAKGIHPIPIPFSDKTCALHGINMSRWAQICHDLAHSKGDAANYNAEQFAHHLANHYVNLLRTGKGDDLPQDQVETYSIPEMLPHFITFSMAVHNRYRQSLVEILMFSLVEMDPRNEGQLPDFKAFCATAFLQAHERPIDISRKYGTPNLSDLLRAGTPQDSETPIKNEGEDNKGDNKKESSYVDQEFETSFITGETELTDKQLFDLVKVKPKREFLNNFYAYFGLDALLNEKEIARYKVLRNKFYIDVEITLRDGEKRLFRKATNYSSQLNFDHDLSILKAARPVLKREYAFDLPKIPAIPNLDDAEAIKTYEQEALQCRMALEQGFTHLLDMWATYSHNLSHKNPSPILPSIADRFALEYKAAYQNLEVLMPDFAGNLGDFIRDAMKPADPTVSVIAADGL